MHGNKFGIGRLFSELRIKFGRILLYMHGDRLDMLYWKNIYYKYQYICNSTRRTRYSEGDLLGYIIIFQIF